jgi:hypothetical protein
MAKTNGNGKKKVIDAEVLPAEVALVEQEHALVLPWFDNLSNWWRSNKAMVAVAKDRLEQSRQRKAPVTEAEDLALQEDLLADRNALKLAEEHAEPFTGAFFRIHRRLTQARAEVTKPLEQSAGILQGLHNAYTAEQRRLAREMEERAIRKAEEDARQRQQEELAELERRAVEREEASADLSDRERRFVEAMLKTNNAVQSAVLAGFKDGLKSGARLMSLGKVTSAIHAARDAAAIRAQALAVANEPAIPFSLPAIRPNIGRASGARERVSWTVEIFDREALHAACLKGECPPDILTIDESRVRRYAEELHELVSAWPGCRAVKNTTTY